MSKKKGKGLGKRILGIVLALLGLVLIVPAYRNSFNYEVTGFVLLAWGLILGGGWLIFRSVRPEPEPTEDPFARDGDEELTRELRSHQICSRVGKIVLGVGGILSVVGVMCGQFVVIFIPGVILGGIGAIVMNKGEKAMKEITSSRIVQEALEEVFDHVDYQPFSHLSSSCVYSADLGFRFDEVSGSDYVKAEYKGLPIEMSDLQLETVDTIRDEETNTDREVRNTVFHGMWLVCDFGKELSANLQIRERGTWSKLLGRGGIQLENQAFNRRFLVTSENEHEAFYILTPHMMEYILGMVDKANGSTSLSFIREGKMHVAIASGRDAFEVGKGRVNAAELRRKFVGEIRYVTDLIDELRLVDTLYKKDVS